MGYDPQRCSATTCSKELNEPLNEDCYYIAYVPKLVKLKSLFGIKIDEVKDLKELD